MIDYYIFLPNDSEDDYWDERHLLGTDNGMGVFWGGTGLKALYNIVKDKPEILESVKIKNSKGNYYNVEQFVLILKRLKIINPK